MDIVVGNVVSIVVLNTKSYICQFRPMVNVDDAPVEVADPEGIVDAMMGNMVSTFKDVLTEFKDIMVMANLDDLPVPSGDMETWSTEIHGVCFDGKEKREVRIPSLGFFTWLKHSGLHEDINVNVSPVDADMMAHVRSGVFDNKIDTKLFWQLHRERMAKVPRVTVYPCQFGKLFGEQPREERVRDIRLGDTLCTKRAVPGRLVCETHLGELQEIGIPNDQLINKVEVGEASIVVELTSKIKIHLKPQGFGQVRR